MKLQDVELEGEVVRLVPLTRAHVDPLCEVALDAALWRWTSDLVKTREDLVAYVEAALDAHSAGTCLPFATVETSSGRVVGSTRFGAIDLRNRRAEIGWTFVAPRWQRTAVNTEAKFLMLRWAFEEQGMVRVELKTDALNLASRRAIERLGATQEGILRKHMQCYGGRVRDTVYYSIVDDEWPSRRRALKSMLAR